MRILHVVTAFPRAPGDIIAPWLVELLRRQRAAGLEVEVFAPAYRGGGNKEFEGIPVHRFRYFPGRWEDLTHDQGTVDRVGRSIRYKLMAPFYVVRSEEHTSELQSHVNLVCRLLLEKKK